MTRWFGRLLALLVGVTVLGCPPPTAVAMCNNTGQDLAVLLDEGARPWPAGETIRIGSGGDVGWNDLVWVWLTGSLAKIPCVTVVRGDSRFLYPVRAPAAPLPPEGYSGVERRRYTVRLQLQPTGELVIVRFSDEMPLKTLPPQPPGYPISPILL